MLCIKRQGLHNPWKVFKNCRKTLSKPEEFENARCAFQCGPETFLKRSFTIIMWFTLALMGALRRFRRRWLLRFHSFVASFGWKTPDLFSEWNAVFKFLQRIVDGAYTVRGSRHFLFTRFWSWSLSKGDDEVIPNSTKDAEISGWWLHIAGNQDSGEGFWLAHHEVAGLGKWCARC